MSNGSFTSSLNRGEDSRDIPSSSKFASSPIQAPKIPAQITTISTERKNDVRKIDRFRFSAFYPERLGAGEVGKIMAYAHLEQAAPKVIKEAVRRLDLPPDTRLIAKSEEPTVPIAKESVIHVTPDVEGLVFQSSQETMSLWEDAQYVEFRFRPDSNTSGKSCSGWIHFWLEGLILASVGVTIFVAEKEVSDIFREQLAKVNAKPYRAVFPSYSHRDADIVERIELYAASIGDEYLRDISKLRSGQHWKNKLRQLINEADIFQLFWSQNAAESEYVKQEWLYALEQRKSRPDPFFVRPVYWTSTPNPSPPPELENLHFVRLPL